MGCLQHNIMASASMELECMCARVRVCALLVVSLCSFFGVFQCWEQDPGPGTWLGKLSTLSYILNPLSLLLKATKGTRVFLFHAVPSPTSWGCSFLHLGCQLLSLDVTFYSSFLSLQSCPHTANTQSSVLCTTHTLTLTPQHRTL